MKKKHKETWLLVFYFIILILALYPMCLGRIDLVALMLLISINYFLHVIAQNTIKWYYEKFRFVFPIKSIMDNGNGINRRSSGNDNGNVVFDFLYAICSKGIKNI